MSQHKWCFLELVPVSVQGPISGWTDATHITIDRPYLGDTATNQAYVITTGYYGPRYRWDASISPWGVGDYDEASLEDIQAEMYGNILSAALNVKDAQDARVLKGLESWGTTDAYNWYDWYYRNGPGSSDWNAPDPYRGDYPNPHMPFMFSNDLSGNYLVPKPCYKEVAYLPKDAGTVTTP